MIISVVNHTNGRLKDALVQKTLRAINRQIKEDFEPYWSMGAELRLEGRSPGKLRQGRRQVHPDMRGDAIIYLWDKVSKKAPLGYHELNYKGIPYSFVFVEIAEKLGESWTVTLSHEVLEMIADPEVNLWVEGPNPKSPKNRKKHVLYWYEVCDAVSADTYEIDDTDVSNFVLPLYFTSGDEFKGRNDFLGKKPVGKKPLRSFGVNPGGFMDYIDPRNNTEGTIFGDKLAKKRMKIKEAAGQLRRAARYHKNFRSRVKKKPKKRKTKRPSRRRATRKRR